MFFTFGYDYIFSHVTLNKTIDWFEKWFYYFDSFSDPKLIGWPLMSSPVGPLIILCLYFIIVFYGKKYLLQLKKIKNDESQENHTKTDNDSPIQCSISQSKLFKMILFLYNCSVSTLNGWIAYELIINAIENQYNFFCELVYPYTDDVHENRIAQAIWWYWASKGIELLDTIFILLKGKTNQLTFLHIYHHSSMFAVWWVGAKFVPGGSTLSGSSVNCVVHVLMYAYYALSSLGCCHKYLQPWKRRLTIIQMFQFTAGIVLGLNSIFTGCAFTRWMQYVFVAYAASFLVLFFKFYVRTYRSKTEKIE